MTTSNFTHNTATSALSDAIRTHWVLLLVQGIGMTALGAAAIVWPRISTMAVEFYAGWMFLFSGLFGLLTLFIAPNVSAFLWALLTAALSMLAGVLLLWHPIFGTISLTVVLIAFFIVEGVFQIAAAFRHRSALPRSWGWLAMSGIADLILAGLILKGWPITAFWALGLVVGVNLISSGLALVMVTVTGRSLAGFVAKVTT
jgi:uncharacterized membrane protein HdeD (DUF308 family)